MFVSQVIFGSEKGNEALLKGIMKKKLEGLHGVEGLDWAECWERDSAERAEYALVSKWDSKEHFQRWLAAEHSGGHKKPEGENGPRPTITKQGSRFQVLQPEDL